MSFVEFSPAMINLTDLLTRYAPALDNPAGFAQWYFENAKAAASHNLEAVSFEVADLIEDARDGETIVYEIRSAHSVSGAPVTRSLSVI